MAETGGSSGEIKKKEGSERHSEIRKCRTESACFKDRKLKKFSKQ